jgi:signal transduction histidine kinase
MTRASEGTGIGLALAKSLVDLLGGSIAFVSALGRGSTFTVELPAHQMALSGVAILKDDIQMEKWVQMEMSDIII